MKIDPHILLKKFVKVQSLPDIYTQITEAINNPRSSIEDFGRIISRDSGLTVRLLRLVNSALYSIPYKIDTITRALIIVGTRELHNLALGTSVISLFQGISEELVNMKSFWRHSVACGIVAKILATYRQETNVERFFIGGLLHDIGRLVIYESLPEKASEALLKCQMENKLLYEVERELLGFDHADLGKIMLENWNIPANLKEMVAYHHNPIASKHYAVESSIIHVADIITHAMQFGSSGEGFVPSLNEAAWEDLNLSPAILGPSMDQTKNQFSEILYSIFPDKN